MQAVASWAAGDQTLVELTRAMPEILTGLGLNALRAGMPDKRAFG